MTLTQTAILVKQFIIISAIALFLGISSFIGYKIWYANYLANLPPVEEKPDIKFGSLPEPKFPKSQVSSSNFTYALDTTTGGLPVIGEDPGFEKIIKVYFMPQTFATLLSPDRAQALAEKFDIMETPEILSETKYVYKNSNKNLVVDLDSGNFLFVNYTTLPTNEKLDDDSKLITDFANTLKNLGVYNDGLNEGQNKIDLIESPEGKTAQISLWPKKIDNKPLVTSTFSKTYIMAVISKGADKLENYLSLNFTYYPIDTTTFATYPLKLPEIAFDNLKSGQGTIIIEPLKAQVSITSVDLGYFLSETYAPYLLPVYIFEGPNFVAYVSAITEQFQLPAN